MSAMQLGSFIGGSILGTAGVNAGVTALLRKGLGSTLSYTPAMIAGGTVSTTLLATIFFQDGIKGLFSEKRTHKLNLIRFGCTLLLGGIAAKLLSREVTKTQACALSVLSFFSSNLVIPAMYGLIGGKSLIEPIKDRFEEYMNAGMWLVGTGK